MKRSRTERDLPSRCWSRACCPTAGLCTARQSALGEFSARKARGVEVFVQRRSVNGVSGWVSYAYGRARWLDGVTGSRSFTDSTSATL